MSPEDFNYFFPYTDNTVIVLIPTIFNTPRIEDNMGGDQPLCEFSEFFDKAQTTLNNYQNGIEGSLPNYYVLGCYDKNYNITFNPNCMIFNHENYKKFKSDMEKCNNTPSFNL